MASVTRPSQNQYFTWLLTNTDDSHRHSNEVKPAMNRDHVLFHLREAKEELDRTIGELTTTPDYASEELLVAMGHLYHHLNTAWNGREASPERTARAEKEDFDAWRKFPSNEELLLD